MNKLRKNIAGLEGYTPGEQPVGEGYIKLNTNENPYPPSPAVIEAIAKEAESLRLYPDPLATALREKAGEVLGLPSGSIIAGNGSDELLTIILRCFVEPGEKVVTPHPTYTLYETLVSIQDGELVRVPLGDDFSVPEEIVVAGAKVTFIANPNSPSGTVTPNDAIRGIAEKAGGILVVDEAYVDFCGEGALRLLEEFDNLIVTRSMSKSFSLAGLRLGFAFSTPAIIEAMLKVKDSYNVSRLAIAGGLAAFEDIEWMRANVRRVVSTRERLSLSLSAMGFRVFPSGANFVLAGTGRWDAGAIFRELKDQKILVRYYDTERLRSCLRISVGTDEEIDALLREIRSIIKTKDSKQ
ncbi:MAG: histidinol-phosphate transaminase [Candidatus Tritonobacter lacicola]|nr:histidinol-phosphate transaminase [Candidatus Tritonobacter lacicola]